MPGATERFLREVQMAACNRHAGTELAERPTLFLEFHGTATEVAEQAARAAEIASANGGAP